MSINSSTRRSSSKILGTSVKLLSTSECREEALEILGASSPLQLPPEHLYVSVVVTAKEFDLEVFNKLLTKKVDDRKYIITGSIKEWRELFLSNPDFDLDPFFHVLWPAIKVKKEGETWMSR